MKIDDLKKLLPEVIVENLSEEKLAKLGEEFDRLVEAKVDERTQVAVKCAETQFNEEANIKLQKLVCQIDEAHKKAFVETFNTLCEKCEKEIASVKAFYDKNVKNEAIKFRKRLCEQVNSFINKQIEKRLPTKQINEAVRNRTALDTLATFKNILNVDTASAMKAVQKPVMEAARAIKKQNKENKLLKEANAQLKVDIDKARASAYLVEHTASLAPEAKNFVRKVLGDANLEYIKENLDHVIAQYKKNVDSNRNALLEKTLASRYSKRDNVNNISRRSLVESTSQPRIQSPKTAEEQEISDIISNFI